MSTVGQEKPIFVFFVVVVVLFCFVCLFVFWLKSHFDVFTWSPSTDLAAGQAFETYVR